MPFRRGCSRICASCAWPTDRASRPLTCAGGVSEEAGLDQQTMNICLQELKRCQKVTPRPTFIVLLGDRYGWQPLPPQIPADEFEEILTVVAKPDDRDLILCPEPPKHPRKGWYRKDLNTGLGCGAGLETGYACTLESRETIRQYLKDSDVVLIVAGMGGATGTGGSPVVAQISGELGAWTIGAVTMPFSFEGKRCSKNAPKGLNKLKETADITVLIPNNAIQHLIPPSATLVDGFNKLDEVLSCVVKTFSNILLTPRMLSPAFTDIKRTFSQLGLSL